MDLGLAGRVALATGGTSGIGRATAVDLAVEGCHVALCGPSGDGLDDVIANVRTAAPSNEAPVTFVGDVADPGVAGEFVAAAVAAFGAVHILVNNAGMIGNDGGFEAVTPEDWEATCRANLHTTVSVTRAVLPHLRRQRWGRIVNVGSEAYGTVLRPAERAFLREKRPTILLERFGRPEGVAAVIAFLGSERTSFINGANLRFDGDSVASVAT